jgi:Fe-S oxidoreductase
VKNVLSPECGHAYMAIRWEGPNLIGRPFTFNVVHVMELLDDLRQKGVLKVKDKFKDPLILHDPCQIVRRGGVLNAPEPLIQQVAENYIPIVDKQKWNWCCGGGGGASAIHTDEAEALRAKVFQASRSGRSRRAGVKTVVTFCANCRIVMEEAIDHYEMDTKLLGLTELLAEHLESDDANSASALP